MSALLLLALAGILGLTMLLLLALGGATAYPTTWPHTLRDIAEKEITRRFENLGPRTQAEHNAANDILTASTSPPDETIDQGLVIDAVAVLTERTDRDAIAAELLELQTCAQNSAVSRQVASVARVKSIRIASYVWMFHASASHVRFAIIGFTWFFPKILPPLLERLKKHSTVLAIIGTITGVLVAAIVYLATPDTESFDWLAFASSIALLFTLAGVFTALAGVYKALITIRFGEPRQWTRRGVLAFIVAILTAVSIALLALTGVVEKTLNVITAGLRTETFETVFARWLIPTALTVVVCLGAYRAVRAIWIRTLYLSERLWGLATVPLMLLVAASFIIYALGIPADALPWLFSATAYLTAALALPAMVASMVEWIQKLRTLTRAGISVPRNGFRWTILVIWLILAVIIDRATLYIHAIGPQAIGSTLHTILSATLAMSSILWGLAILPGLLITGLYVWRVQRTFTNFRYEATPDHPALAEEPPAPGT